MSCIVLAQGAWGVQHNIVHSGACTGDLERAVQPFAHRCVHGELWGVHGEDLTVETWCGGRDKRQHSLHHPPESTGVIPPKKQSQASHRGCPEQLYCGGDPGGSAGGPAHLPPPQHVEVQVVDGLGAVLPVIDHCQERDRGVSVGVVSPVGGHRGGDPPHSPSRYPSSSPCAFAVRAATTIRCPRSCGEGAGGSALRVPCPHSCPPKPPLTWASCASTQLSRGMGRLGITKKCTGACGVASRKARHCGEGVQRPETLTHSGGGGPRVSPLPPYLLVLVEDGGRHGAGDDPAEDGGLRARPGGRPLRLAHLPVLHTEGALGAHTVGGA